MTFFEFLRLEKKYLKERRWDELEQLSDQHLNYLLLEVRIQTLFTINNREDKKRKEATWQKIKKTLYQNEKIN